MEYPKSNSTIRYYEKHAQELAAQYLSVDFEVVHKVWLSQLAPIMAEQNVRVLDVGAGAGRDAKYLAELGKNTNVHVVAVEPAIELAAKGQQHTHGLNVKWIADTLPALSKVAALEVSFDLILLSAVWMHIPSSNRARAIRKLANLLKPGGKLVISLRHGPSGDERTMHDVSVDELRQLGASVGLNIILDASDKDNLGRGSVHWQTVVLQLPDDGTGAFPLIRHIAVNDNKASTYKLALLRVLLRIADGHPGAAQRDEQNSVILPMGLVALYWCHQFKPLVDQYQIKQNSDPNKGLGFIKENGWGLLTDRTSEDYSIGNLFLGDEAKALYRTLSQAAQTIKNMPCRYISLPNSNEQVFHVEYKAVKAKDSLFLDVPALNQWGNFILPESMWLVLSRFSCWIEPVLVNEWVNVMQGYSGNEKFDKAYLFNSLAWAKPDRTTAEIRKRVDQLQQEHGEQQCVWTLKKLKPSYDIDHCMPFSRWPNNDLWNLLPSSSAANNQKKDKLPTLSRLDHSRQAITEWWQQAWIANTQIKGSISKKQRFFAEANLALPGLSNDNDSVDELFEALILQSRRLKEMQQLAEW